jgi:hypothetical protein
MIPITGQSAKPYTAPSLFLCLVLALPNLGCSVATRRGNRTQQTAAVPADVATTADVVDPATPTNSTTNNSTTTDSTTTDATTNNSTLTNATTDSTASTTSTSSTPATTSTSTATTLQDLQVTIISATPQHIVGQAYDPTNPTGAPLPVDLLLANAPNPGAAVFRTIANLDIPEASRKGSGFKMDITGLSPPLAAGDRVAVRAWAANLSRTQISDIIAVAAPAATTTTTTETAADASTTTTTTSTAVDPDIVQVPENTENFVALGAAVGMDPAEVAKLSERDLCFVHQRILMGALVTYDRAKPERPADFTLQTLVTDGFLPALFDDPGQGARTSNHYIIDPTGVNEITCVVHGAFVANSTTASALGANF